MMNPEQSTEKKLLKISEAVVNNANDRKQKLAPKLNQALPNLNENKTGKITAINFISQLNSSHKTYPFCPKTPNDKTKEGGKVPQTLSSKLYETQCQLQKLKSILSKAENQIIIKDQEIDKLKQQIKVNTVCKHHKSKNGKIQESNQNETQNAKYFYRKCLKLEEKVKEMEDFLYNYGLVSVDNKIDNGNLRKQMIHNYIEKFYDQLVINVAQLNAAVQKDEIVIQHDKKGASFKSPICMALQFYKNGLVVQHGPLRPYHDNLTKSFIQDILDGYFPSELQISYPNGVLFKIEDHRRQGYTGKGFGFTGQGYKLRENCKPEKTNCKMRENKSNANNLQRYKPIEFKSDSSKASSPRSNGCSKLSNRDSINSNLKLPILTSNNVHYSTAHIKSHINTSINLKCSKQKQQNVSSCSIANHTTENLAQSNDSLFYSKRNVSRYNSLERLSSFRLCTKPNQLRLRSRSASSLRNGNVSFFPPEKCIKSSRSHTNSNNSGSARSDKLPLSVYVNEPSGRSGEFRLKIRSLNGCILYLVYVTASDTVSELYEIMNNMMPKTKRSEYKIVVSGPGLCKLEDMDSTLGKYGISTDSVFHISSD